MALVVALGNHRHISRAPGHMIVAAAREMAGMEHKCWLHICQVLVMSLALISSVWWEVIIHIRVDCVDTVTLMETLADLGF